MGCSCEERIDFAEEKARVAAEAADQLAAENRVHLDTVRAMRQECTEAWVRLAEI